jgi:UDP-N-acetylmuramyl-tripeptide synthetase
MLLSRLGNKGAETVEDRPITGIYYDSRQVAPGGLFVAIPGTKVNGQAFVAHAIDRGAVAIVAEKAVAVPAGVRMVQVTNARRSLATLAAAFYGDPSEDLVVVGITGTNGKTTTSYLLEAILQTAGYNVGVIGTINYRFNGATFVNPVTTPESADLMRILRSMLDGGVTHAVLEVSSHSLDLDRVSSCSFDVGVFTNLTQDHLDYHKDMETYWQCKKKLCIQCLEKGTKREGAVAVINRDDSRGAGLVSEVSVACLAIGLSSACQIRGDEVAITIDGIAGKIHTPAGSIDFKSSLVGKHNVYNVLTAAGASFAMGISLEDIRRGIASLPGVPGRLERIANSLGFSIFVDYAHTPDALDNVLSALRPLTAGRLICVFGCGGDRDRKKRPIMGATVARLSDLSILTSDNPRSETPAKILADIEAGTVTVERYRYEKKELEQGFHRKGYMVEPDRSSAIALGLTVARPGDAVLIAGKGHETYQIIGQRTIAFDDRLEAKKVLDRLTAKSGGGL